MSRITTRHRRKALLASLLIAGASGASVSFAANPPFTHDRVEVQAVERIHERAARHEHHYRPAPEPVNWHGPRHDVAASFVYIGFDGTTATWKSDRHRANEEPKLRGMRIRLGKTLAGNLDIEGHVGFIRDHADDSDSDYGTTLAGAFLKPYLPLSEYTALYGLGGLGAVMMDDGRANDDRGKRSGIAWGLGLETRLSRRIDLTGDYVRYLADDEFMGDVSAFSLGLRLYF